MVNFKQFIFDQIIVYLFTSLFFYYIWDQWQYRNWSRVYISSVAIIFLNDGFNPIQDGLFRGCSRMGRAPSVTHMLQWWNLAQLYLTQRRSKKCMNHVTYPFSSADIIIFHQKSTNFPISRNTKIDCILIHYFYLF